MFRLPSRLARFLAALAWQVVSLALATSGTHAQRAINPDTTYKSDSSIVYVYNDHGITVFPLTDGFEYVYVSKNAPTVASVATQRGLRFMINASYFAGERLNAQHAGWLRLLGKSFAPLMKDRQLTHIVVFTPDVNSIEFVPWQKFRSSGGDSTIEFQTGPLVVDSNKVARSLIAASINGSGNYPRTLLAVSHKSELWFITARKPVSLEILGDFLVRLSLFQHKRLDVVNLDGGSSVAFYAKPFPQLDFNTDDHLPLLLGVR